MRIQVTAKNIMQGTRGSYQCCPVAIACQEAFAEPLLEVGEGVLSLFDHSDDGKPIYRRSPLPIKVRDFIVKFDAGEPVQPFEFDIDRPR